MNPYAGLTGLVWIMCGCIILFVIVMTAIRIGLEKLTSYLADVLRKTIHPSRPKPSSRHSYRDASKNDRIRRSPVQSLSQPIEKYPEFTLALLQAVEWKRFEQVTEAFFQHKGWQTEIARIGPDGGIDIKLFHPDEVQVAAVVQCKAWNNRPVGVNKIRELFGVMAAGAIEQGYFVITNEFTGEARAFARDKPLTLIDGDTFMKLIMNLPAQSRAEMLAIATEGDYRTPTCPGCGGKMVPREGSKGSFWGCPNYPRCRQTFQFTTAHRRNSPGEDTC